MIKTDEHTTCPYTLRAEINELLAENAKLHDDLKAFKQHYDNICRIHFDKVLKFEAEIEQLKKGG